MINEKDIREIFIRSSGPGGQNVNKVSTAVMLLHIPTGIQVKCQKFRLQSRNRVLARELLTQAVIRKEAEARKRAQAVAESERRRNRRRPKALKESILESKRRLSRKKASRRSVCHGQE